LQKAHLHPGRKYILETWYSSLSTRDTYFSLVEIIVSVFPPSVELVLLRRLVHWTHSQQIQTYSRSSQTVTDISKNAMFVCYGGPNVRVLLNFVLQTGSKCICLLWKRWIISLVQLGWIKKDLSTHLCQKLLFLMLVPYWCSCGCTDLVL